LIGAGAALASAVGYALQRELSYVSRPAWIGELEFYGVFASLAFIALVVGAIVAWPPRGRRSASPLAWLSVAAAVVSALGYVVQTIFDHVYVPPRVAVYEFWGGFIGVGCLALVTGGLASLIGLRQRDLTMSLGFIAVAYVLFAQLTQSLWD
jgi:small-conductance mechanosensitive channel